MISDSFAAAHILATMSRKLQNYVRTYRRRSGLTQSELAFLVGCENGSNISRYERFLRVPTLETAFAYEALFGAPARELFAGVHERTATKIQERAKVLAGKLAQGKSNSASARKLQLLTALSTSRSAKEINPRS